MKKDSLPVTIGFPDEWQRFARKHPGFIFEFDKLTKTFGHVFGRLATTTSIRDRIIFFLGSLCVEEFKEIFLLCGNGYGIGAAKLLRGLYERAVNCAYLAADPVAFTDFLNFHHVQRYRELNHLKSVKGVQLRMSDEEVGEICAKYERVKRHFEEILCETCGTRRLRPAWSNLDLRSMARRAGRAYGWLYFSCYFQPTMQAHSTVQAFGVRLKPRKDGGIDFSGAAQRNVSSRVMGLSHAVILLVLGSQDDYFKLGLSDEIRTHSKEWGKLWERIIYPRRGTRIRL